MPSRTVSWRWLPLLVLLGTVAPAAGGDNRRATSEAGATRKITSAEQTRAALDQSIPLDFTSQNLQEALNHLGQKINIHFVLDTLALQQLGIGADESPTPAHLKVERGKVRTGLQKMLHQYHLSYVILGDSVLVTSEEIAQLRQMRQRVDVDVEDMPLHKALRQLARETATNLIIDPHAAREAQKAVSLQLDDVALETAVRLLAYAGGLRSLRVGNVLIVTTEARAERLAQDQELSRPGGVDPGAGDAIGGGGTVPLGRPAPAAPGNKAPVPAAPAPENTPPAEPAAPAPPGR